MAEGSPGSPSSRAQVPIVDLSPGSSEARQAAVVAHVCVEHGFFYCAGHGVPAPVLDEAFAQFRHAFQLPLSEKQKLLADENNRGYTPYQEETLDPANQTSGDTKEGFYFGREVPADSAEAALPLHGPNQWPDPALLPGFREAVEAYFTALTNLGHRLLRLLALSLGLPVEHFEPAFRRPMLALRPLHYSAEVSAPSEGVFGCGAHSDYGCLTLLMTDGTPGLQAHLGGRWQASAPPRCWRWPGRRAAAPRGADIPQLPGAFIVNLGDMLERWTNGRYKSTLHRVVSSSGRERYSIAFFFEPSFDTVVECLPCCCSPEAPARYPPTTAGAHLLEKYAHTHEGYDAGAKQQRLAAEQASQQAAVAS